MLPSPGPPALALALGSDWLHAGAWESSPQHRSWPDYPLVVKCLQDCIAANFPPSRPIEVTHLVNTKMGIFSTLTVE